MSWTPTGETLPDYLLLRPAQGVAHGALLALDDGRIVRWHESFQLWQVVELRLRSGGEQ